MNVAAIPSEHFSSVTHRFVADRPLTDALAALDLSPDEIKEVTQLVSSRHLEENRESLLDGPFLPRPNLMPVKTRFSDGSVRVFYSAIEPATAQAEISYWYAKPLLSGSNPREVFYRLLECHFEGNIKDLRPHLDSMPFLTADDGYDECNELAREAVSARLAGLLAPSARKAGGTCLPVFRRESLSSARLGSWFLFQYDPKRSEVSVREIAS